MTRIDDIREYHDTHDDTAAELAGALASGEIAYEDDTEADPMITTSLRLPRSTLAAVRALAAREHIKPTAMMRRLIEEGMAAGVADSRGLEAIVARLRADVDELGTRLPAPPSGDDRGATRGRRTAA